MALTPIERIALIGFGEAGGIFGRDFAQICVANRSIRVSAFDILLGSQESREAMISRARESGVRVEETMGDCLRDAHLVISAVTASSALDVAGQSAAILRSGQTFLDINSVSPGTKR